MGFSDFPEPFVECLDNYMAPKLPALWSSNTAAADTPCAACTGARVRQRRCPYHSKLELSRSADDRVTWSVGTKATLEDRPANPRCLEVRNVQFVQANTTIPVPEVMVEWNDGGRCFVLAKTTAGKPLEAAWPSMSTADKRRVAEQTAHYLGQLRELQSSRIQSVDGEPLYLPRLFSRETGGPYGPISTDTELWGEMLKELPDAPWGSVFGVMGRIPPSAPYTFSHGDLSLVNILVENGNLAGIVGWGGSGYLPVWWEYVQTRLSLGPEDLEWKSLLRKHMTHFPEALLFCRCFHGIQTSVGKDKGRSAHAYPSFWTDD